MMRASIQYFLCRGLSALAVCRTGLPPSAFGSALGCEGVVVVSTAAGRPTNFGVSAGTAGVATSADLVVSAGLAWVAAGWSADAVLRLRDCPACAVADTRTIAAIRANLCM